MEIRITIPSLRVVLVVLAALGLVFTGLGIYQFNAKRQLDRAFDRMTAAVESRNWERVRTMIADDYHDAWGMNASQAVEIGSEVLQHFLVLSLDVNDPVVEVAGRRGTVRSDIKISGNATAIGQAVMSEVDALRAPFVFEWKQESWVPWSWKLTSISHPEIHFDPTYRF